MGELERRVIWTPAYDKRSADPKKNYGIHGMDLRFLLGDARGWVQFVIFTNWHLEHVEKELRLSGYEPWPMPAAVSYHSPTPQYEGQTATECDLLGNCYYDGSGLAADPLFAKFCEHGETAVWEHLLGVWERRFGSSKEA